MEWVQFSDKKPEHQGMILVSGYIDDHCYLDLLWYSEGTLYREDGSEETYKPDPEDYWMSLDDIPKPPKMFT